MAADIINTVQALVDRYGNAERGHASAIYCGAPVEVVAEWQRKVFATHAALIAQMQRDAVQPAVPGTVDEILEWIVSMSDDEPIRNMAHAARTKLAEAQALDSQLQQPDADSTRASGVCASTAPAEAAAPRTKRKLVGYEDCRCVLTQYCDGKCRPIFADVPIPDAPSRRSASVAQSPDVHPESAPGENE